MSALDLTGFSGTTDSEELREYKEKIREVAKVYTKRHGWCREVKNALKELGIEDEKKVQIELTTSMGFVLNTQILPSNLVGKSEQEQKEILAKHIGSLNLVGNGGTQAAIAVTAESITEMKLVSKVNEPPTGKTLMTTTSGLYRYVWRRIGDGRVLHLFQLENVTHERIHRQDYPVTASDIRGDSFCGQVNGRYGRLMPWNAAEAERAECARCASRVVTYELQPYVAPAPARALSA
jgi:hypothetical protein